MKKFIFIFAMMWIGLMPLDAQRIYFADGPWKSFMGQRCAFELVAFGAYSNGVEINRVYPQGTNAHEGMVLVANQYYHVNTLDGDFVYDAKADGQYLRLSNKSRKNANGINVVDYQHSSWIKLIWCENGSNGMMLFTVDSYGTYRYFRYIGEVD